MTVIAVKDGALAVDSAVVQGSTYLGDTEKFRNVPEHLGGGIVAGCGSLEGAAEAMDHFCQNGGDVVRIEGREYDLVHLRSDGSIWCSEWGSWARLIGDFFAFGSGGNAAMGAMSGGATAEEAVSIACRIDVHCGGEVHVFEVIK